MGRTKKEIAGHFSELLERELDAPINLEDLDSQDVAIPKRIMSLLAAGHVVTMRQLLIYRMVLNACRGNEKSTTEIFDRLVGKAPQYIEQLTATVGYEDFMAKCDELDELERDARQLIAPSQSDIVDVNVDHIAENKKFLDELEQL